MTQSAWFDPVTHRIDVTGLEISAKDWAEWVWYDVTTHEGYRPGVHRYIRIRRMAESVLTPGPCSDNIDKSAAWGGDERNHA